METEPNITITKNDINHVNEENKPINQFTLILIFRLNKTNESENLKLEKKNFYYFYICLFMVSLFDVFVDRNKK